LKRRRGFLIVFALLLTVLISLIGMSLLSIQRSQYSSSKEALRRAQCRALARAGMENAEIKIAKDPFFPSGVGDNHVLFSYSEEVTSVQNSGELLGSFTISIDKSDEQTLKVIRVQSVAILGQRTAPTARYTIYGELSVDPEDFGYKVWQEGGLPKL
jgi:hypothetical protein